eukprot:m.606945 g.606945  ORF g.606945 m.606945 type:complete len:340 (-) comp22474_c2_seq2:273-1292(-)
MYLADESYKSELKDNSDTSVVMKRTMFRFSRSVKVTLLFSAMAATSGVHGDVFSEDSILSNHSHYFPDCEYIKGDLICSQRPSDGDVLKVGCVGDSITAVGHTSSKMHQYPSQLQQMFDAKKGTGKYSVTNLGTCGTTLSDHGASPYWDSATYRALLSAKWDIIVVMLGTNDARDIGSGGPEHWPREQCDHATMDTLESCPFYTNYTKLLSIIKGLGNETGIAPEIHIMIPPALMEQGAYGMNQTIINTVLPRLIPLIGAANKIPVIDVYKGMGGVPAPAWTTELPPKCVLNSTWPPCRWYCDAQSCNPGQCHPNDVGCTHLAEVVYDGIVAQRAPNIY